MNILFILVYLLKNPFCKILKVVVPMSFTSFYIKFLEIILIILLETINYYIKGIKISILKIHEQVIPEECGLIQWSPIQVLSKLLEVLLVINFRAPWDYSICTKIDSDIHDYQNKKDT